MKKPYQLPGDFIEALKTRPTAEIESIFDELVKKKLAEIPGAVGAEALLAIQSQAKYAQELLQFFLAEMQRK